MPAIAIPGTRANKPRACYELKLADQVDDRHEYEKALPERRERRRMGIRRPLPDFVAFGRRPTRTFAARGIQWVALARQERRALAAVAARSAAVVHGVPADAALDQGRMFRGDCT